MVIVQSPLKRDYIIELLDGQTINGFTFKFEKRDEMKLYFSHDGDAEEAASVAKNTVKKSEFGPALYFRVIHE